MFRIWMQELFEGFFVVARRWSALRVLFRLANVALAVSSSACGSVCEHVESWLTHPHKPERPAHRQQW